MLETIALLLVFAIGYYMLLADDPAQWWREKLRDWIVFCRKRGVGDQNVLWLLVAGVPAVAVGLLDVVVNSASFHFFLAGLFLLLGMKVTSYMRYQAAIIKAVYANDAALAMRLANQWEDRDDGLEDSRDRFVPRMLELCAVRMSEDILASLVWFVLLGPAGVVLFTASHVLFGMPWAKPVKFNPLEWVAQVCSNSLFAVSGNMVRAVQALSARSAKAALEAGNINPEQIDLELVPGYGKMLIRSMFIGIGLAALVLL